ncbi:MAG TPA: hypothetical protein VL307_17290 [Chitinophagaceae bacterium]|nr:hypothetical protein [Chitinophagaceae bacterium]
MTILIVVWIVLSLLVALIGSSRNAGFTRSLLLAIFLTPLIGIIIAWWSGSKKDSEKKKNMDRLSKEYLDLIKGKR